MVRSPQEAPSRARVLAGTRSLAPVAMPRTAFQAADADGSVTIEAGLDREPHDCFANPDKHQPCGAAALARPRRRNRLLRAESNLDLLVIHHGASFAPAVAGGIMGSELMM